MVSDSSVPDTYRVGSRVLSVESHGRQLRLDAVEGEPLDDRQRILQPRRAGAVADITADLAADGTIEATDDVERFVERLYDFERDHCQEVS